jgi:hypothetical protein
MTLFNHEGRRERKDFAKENRIGSAAFSVK